jgi:hypothetical protein
MKANKLSSLINENYERKVIVLLEKFCNKHSIEFECWVDNKFGCVANFGNIYFIDMQDIVWDILSNQPNNNIIKWLYYCSENYKHLNYFDYTLIEKNITN